MREGLGVDESIARSTATAGRAVIIAGGAAEPWVEVIRQFEPSAFPAVSRLLAHPDLSARIRGTVIDVGAGTCFLSAKLSRLAAVERVYPIDLSEAFLTSTGARMLQHFDAAVDKVTFVATDFNEIPLPDASADAAFIAPVSFAWRSPTPVANSSSCVMVRRLRSAPCAAAASSG